MEKEEENRKRGREHTVREGEIIEIEIENMEREGENTEREAENKGGERENTENTERDGENSDCEGDKIWNNKKSEYLERRKTRKNKEEEEARKRVERERERREREGEVGKRMETERSKWENRTEEWLCDAAMRGDEESLKQIIEIDEYILDKVLVGSFKGKNPLHVAILTGQKEFVLELLKIKEDLGNVLDTELGTALHIASSKGYLEIVELLVEVSPGMCVARDREGNNPLHIAAMQGKVEVLKVLLQACPHAALFKVDQGDTILHMCVNHNQLESLKLLLKTVGDHEFINSIDTNGNNILHLAVFCKREEIVKYVLCDSEIDVNARNGWGWTAMDIIDGLNEKEDPKDDRKDDPKDDQKDDRKDDPKDDQKDDRKDDQEDRMIRKIFAMTGKMVGEMSDAILVLFNIKDWKGEYGNAAIECVLRKEGAKRCVELFLPFNAFEPKWQTKKKETLMIVSSLMATIAFQVGVNPPGGVWQDTSSSGDPLPHVAGKAITAYNYPNAYRYFMYFNTIGFLLSLTTILDLVVALPSRYNFLRFFRSLMSWMAIMATAYAYTFSVTVVLPTENYEKPVSHGILVIVIVWAVLMTFCRLLPLPYKVRLICFVIALILLVVVGLVVAVAGYVPVLAVGLAVLAFCGVVLVLFVIVVIVCGIVFGIVFVIVVLPLWIATLIKERWSRKKANETTAPSELPA